MEASFFPVLYQPAAFMQFAGMLEIIVKPSPTSPGGNLDLVPGTRLDIDRPMDAFDEDLTSGEYSLPIEIPWTENNRIILGHSERLENFIAEKVNSWICDVYANGYPELLNASINLLSKEGLISYSSGKFTANISASKGQFGSLTKGKSLKDFKYGETITWAGFESREFATRHAKGLIPGLNHLAFAPVVIQEYFDTSKNFFGEFLAGDTVNNIVSTGGGSNDWVFGRTLSTGSSTATEPGHVEHIDFRTVPFFKVKYILQQLMANLGYVLQGAALDSAILDDLYIYNTRSIEDYDFGIKVDKNRKIIVSDHLPDIPVVDFLRDTFKFLNVYPVFSGGLTVDLKDRASFVRQKNILDVSKEIVSDFSADYTPVEDQGGYTLDYEADSEDGYFSEAVRDINDKTFVGSVNTLAQLATFNIGRPFTTEDIAFVESENLYYIFADIDGATFLWNAYADRLHPLVIGNGNRSVSLGAGTLATYLELDENTGLYRRRSKLASRQQGCYINNKGSLINRPFSLRFFYIKNHVIGGNSYPVSFNHRTNTAGTEMTAYSLALQGEKSLGAMHKPWQDMQNHPEKYTISLQANRKLLNDMADNNMIMVNNVVLVPRSVNLSIPLSDTLKVQVVPL